MLCGVAPVRVELLIRIADSAHHATQGSGAPPPEKKPPTPKPDEAKAAEEASSFKAFTGKPRSLRD
jgi:hypothetical protein